MILEKKSITLNRTVSFVKFQLVLQWDGEIKMQKSQRIYYSSLECKNPVEFFDFNVEAHISLEFISVCLPSKRSCHPSSII